MTNERPVLTLPKTRQTMILNGVAIAGLVALCVVAIQSWPNLPERFPIHFDIQGNANGWGGKTTLIWLPILGLATYALLTLLVRFPHSFNYMVRITDTNASRQYQIACSLINWLKAETIWLYAYTEWKIVDLATAETPTLGLWFLPISLIIIFGTMGYWLWQSFLAR